MTRSNDDFAIYFAMMKAGYERKPKLSPAEYARRLAIEKLKLQRHYSEVFALWRDCGRPACRRHQGCIGDRPACLQRGLDFVPHDVQRRARQKILAATPAQYRRPRARRAAMHAARFL